MLTNNNLHIVRIGYKKNIQQWSPTFLAVLVLEVFFPIYFLRRLFSAT